MLNLEKVLEAIDAHSVAQREERYEIHLPAESGEPRKYLGLSMLGEPCKRRVWLSWRHCGAEKFPPRLFRLFRRGAREEYVINHTLRGIGFTVHDTDARGKQFKVTDFEGHLSGHVDGVSEAPVEFWSDGTVPHPFLLEYKTYNVKRFTKLSKEGVRKSDPKYYAQMQGYMGYLRLKAALFYAVCKDDDSIHLEWVPFKRREFEQLVDVACDVLGATFPNEGVPKISQNPSWYQCRYCNFKGICHEGLPSAKSCRSCAHAEPVHDAGWVCKAGHKYGEVCVDWKDIARVK